LKFNTNIIIKIASLLSGASAINQGESNYKEWVSELLTTCFSGINIPAYGAILIPQVGDGAGRATCLNFCESSSNEKKCDLVKKIIEETWESFPSEKLIGIIDVPDILEKIHTYFISSQDDKPIGLIWALANNKKRDKVEAILFFISKIILTAVYETKGINSLTYLASDSWYEDSRSKIAKKVASLCARALGCKQVIVWEADYKKEELITKYVVGEKSNLHLDLDFGEGLAGKCFSVNNPHIYNNLFDEDVAHRKVVVEENLRSCIMVPLDVGNKIAGVMGAYAERVGAFNSLDLIITKAFAQRLCAGYLFANRLEELEELEERAFKEAPAIEAGLLAMELVHDINDRIGFAQGELGSICSYYKNNKASLAYRSADQASIYLDGASEQLKLLTKRSKLKKLILKQQNLSHLLDEIKKEFRKKLKDSNIDLSINDAEGIIVNIDKMQFRRIITNIINNSIYFLATTRRQDKYIRIEVESQPSGILIKIEDNGPGISPYEIDQVFDLFYTSKGDKGMGLGLALGKRIAEEHGGTIEAHSHWGHWAQFIIILPA